MRDYRNGPHAFDAYSQIFTALVAKADVQMCFAPSDEAHFFDALRAGLFDAKAVCNTVDAMKATATMDADKTMILTRIQEEVGLESYNAQLRTFLEQQYQLVALKVRARKGAAAGASSSGNAVSSSDTSQAGAGSNGDFAEVLKHIRRMATRLEAMETKLDAVEKKQEAAARVHAAQAQALLLLEPRGN